MPTRFATISAGALAAMALLTASAALAAERSRPPGSAAQSGRVLPPGTPEAEVRRYCTQKYDEGARLISDAAGGPGGRLIDQLLIEFQECLRRHGVTP